MPGLKRVSPHCEICPFIAARVFSPLPHAKLTAWLIGSLRDFQALFFPNASHDRLGLVSGVFPEESSSRGILFSFFLFVLTLHHFFLVFLSSLIVVRFGL